MHILRAIILLAVMTVAAILNSAPAQAATVSVDYNMDLAYKSVHGVRSDTSTYSTDLVGALFRAVYTDGTAEDWNWVRYSEYGAATDHISDDLAFDYRWWGFEMQVQKGLRSFEVNLAPASVIWDAGEYPEWDLRNTPTTYGGEEFRISDGNNALSGAVNATYFNRLRVGDNPIGEDVFTNLLIDFSGLTNGGLFSNITWSFDMDVLAVAGDLTPVPLPKGILLLLAAIGTFALMRTVPRRDPMKDALTA